MKYTPIFGPSRHIAESASLNAPCSHDIMLLGHMITRKDKMVTIFIVLMGIDTRTLTEGNKSLELPKSR